jgi:hypothetical protein
MEAHLHSSATTRLADVGSASFCFPHLITILTVLPNFKALEDEMAEVRPVREKGEWMRKASESQTEEQQEERM